MSFDHKVKRKTITTMYLSPVLVLLESPSFLGGMLGGPAGSLGGGVDMNGGGTLKLGGGTDMSGGGPGGSMMRGGGMLGVLSRPGPLGVGGARLMLGRRPGPTLPGRGISSGRGMSMMDELLLLVGHLQRQRQTKNIVSYFAK